MEPSTRRHGVFFGWYIVAALFFILFNTTGMGFYSFPVFVGPIQTEFGWSMTEISTGVGLSALVSGLASPLIGMLIGRYGARRVMLACGLMTGICNLGYAALQSLWMLYAIMALAGFAVAGITILPSQTVVTNWFNRYRGRAMALAFLGPGAGGFLMPPFNEFLIRLWGWRPPWVLATAILWLLVVPLTAIFVRTKPSEMGLAPDGEARPEPTRSSVAGALSGLPVKRALRSQTFWLLFSISILLFTGLSALNFHFVPFAEQEVGFTSQQAAFYYGLAVGFSIAGRLLAGWLADRMRPHHLVALTALVMASGPAALEVFVIRLGLRDPALLWLYAIPYGVGFGANVITNAVLIGRCFGELDFAKISGIIGMGFALGVVVGIPAAGNVFDRFGSYEAVILACVFGCLLSAALALRIRPERHHDEFVTA